MKIKDKIAEQNRTYIETDEGLNFKGVGMAGRLCILPEVVALEQKEERLEEEEEIISLCECTKDQSKLRRK